MKYPFKVYLAEKESKQIWLAESDVLEGCVGEGTTATDAVAQLEITEEKWMSEANEYGVLIPTVPLKAYYSKSFSFSTACRFGDSFDSTYDSTYITVNKGETSEIYKGFVATFRYDESVGVFYGHISNATSAPPIYGNSIFEAIENFHKCVNEELFLNNETNISDEDKQ